MTGKNYWRLAAVALTLGLAFSAAGVAATQASKELANYVGRWQINLEKTRMGRLGPTGQNIKRAPTFTWQFTPEGAGLRMDVYNEYPLAKPTRSMTVVVDAKQRRCQNGGAACLTSGGNGDEQSYAYFSMDPYMLARLFYEKGKVVEYSTYAVSTDGKTLTIVSWSPETPQWQNIQVFDKQPQ